MNYEKSIWEKNKLSSLMRILEGSGGEYSEDRGILAYEKSTWVKEILLKQFCYCVCVIDDL